MFFCSQRSTEARRLRKGKVFLREGRLKIISTLSARAATAVLVTGGFASALRADDVQPGVDMWFTPAGSYSDEFSSTAGGTPLPAGFFDPGSDPFDGTVSLRGKDFQYFGTGGCLAPADTIIWRTAVAPLPSTQCPVTALPIPIEIIALSLTSSSPITVTYGGLNPELWDVDVCLSDYGQQPGSIMKITHSCPDGGTFSSTLLVTPKFTFIRQSDLQVRVLDIGDPQLSRNPVVLTTTSGFWMHSATFPITPANAGDEVDGNCDGTPEALPVGTSNFYPGIFPFPCDCSTPPGGSQPQKDLTDEQALLAAHGILPPQHPQDSDGDGIPDACETAVDYCPLPAVNPWCQFRRTQDCLVSSTTDVICLVKQVRFDATGNPYIEMCDCYDGVAACGPVDIQPNPVPPGGFTVSCPGPCPPGENCELHFDGNPTGMNSIDSSAIPAGALVTCACVLKPVELCPLPTVNPWCTSRQATDCVVDSATDVICLVKQARAGSTGDPIIELCDCYDGVPACGPVDIRPNPVPPGGFTYSCPGPCPPGENCELHFDGNPTGMNSIDSSAIPAGALVTCACVPKPVELCPLPTDLPWCQNRQTLDCVVDSATDVICLVKQARAGSTGDPIIELCDCYDGVPACGPVDIQPDPVQGGFTYSCPGPCPPGENCELHFDGNPTGMNSINSSAIPPGALVTCECVAQPEACCFVDGHCEMLLAADCLLIDGTPQGPGTTCSLLQEACCLSDGTCMMTDPLCCDDLGGTSMGSGSQCTAPEACCKTDGTCADLDPLCCVQQGGEPKGTGTSCANTTCAVPTQACCLPKGVCVEVTYDRCLTLGGDPQGPDTICDMRVCNPLKWAQPPTYGPAITPQPPCFWGWDDPSNYLVGPIVADDWACSTNQPITDIHWWGSYQNWTTREPPPQELGPDLFHIGIWKDVPANVDRPFSHPGTMIHQWVVPRMELNERYVGCDEYPGMPSDTCFRYDFTILNSEEWFYQKPSADPTIYWVSISAIYGMPPMQYPWGWKTREHFYNDDAVRIFNPVAPGLGASFVDGFPIETPDGKSWDMAFVLTTRRQAGVKWEQWPNPTLPGLHAHDGITLADNWECVGGKVTDLHWWGNYELDDQGQERRGAGIQCINLSIHRNQPGVPWCLPQEPAEWGVCALFDALHERDTGLENNEGSKIYLYDFYLPDGFAQLPGDIYWLDIEAQSTNPQDPALWRWQENDRTSVPRLCPAAQRSMPPPPFVWSSIEWPQMPPDPPLYSEMAFRVTSRPYPPGPDPTGVDKTRFISLAPSNAGEQTALMVTLTSLHRVDPPYTGGTATDFTAWEGEVRWVGPPQQYVESNSSGVLFWASTLQCEPYYQDWSTVSLLHVTGAEIVPSSLYDVQAVSMACQGAETGCADVSTALRIGTTRWGDIWPAYNPPSPTTQPDFADIGALVDKFKSALGAPIKARALLAGQVPNMVPDVSFAHISACVDGFKGLGYPYPGPCVCPSTVTCNQTFCTTPAQCVTGQTCVGGFCRDACERCTP